MQKRRITKEDQAAGLVDVTSVSVISYLKLQVTFEDGLQGIVEFSPERLTGVFEALKDESYFNQVHVHHGAVTWPNELDLAPDTMYLAIVKNGIQKLEK